MSGLTQIFTEALDVPEDRRDAFLQDACGGDDELRAEVESLLAYHRGHTITGAPSGARPRTDPTGRRRRLALVALTLSILSAVLGAAVHGILRARLETDVRARLTTTLDAGVRAHRAWIEGWKSELAAYAARPILRERLLELVEFTQGREVRGSEMVVLEPHKELQRLVQPLTSRESVRNVNAANRENLMIFFDRFDVEDRVFRLNPEGARRLAPALAGRTVASAPHPIRTNLVEEGEPGETTQIIIVTPVRGDDDGIFAVLTLRLDPEEAITQLLHDALGASGDMYAVDRKGMLVSRSRRENELEAVGLLPEGKSSVVHVSSRDPGGDLTDGFAPDEPSIAWPLTKMATLATAGHSGVDVKGYRDFRGRDVVGAWAWLTEYDIGIAHEIETDEVYASIRRVDVAFGVTVAVLLSLAGYGYLSTLPLERWRGRVLDAERLGQYRLEDVIGEGGMATVYRARHTMLDRPVAIKLLRGDRLGTDALERFKREVKIVSRLNHRNTIQILDYGQTSEGSPFFVMELVSGITLADLVRTDGAPPPGRAVFLLTQVCQSLSEAHRLGVVHRDIKPANIMVGHRTGEADVVKVLDFGLATTVVSTQITEQHLLGGTLVYIAPERIQNPALVDPASDIYAFGAVAFFLLTGREVIEGGSPEEVLMATLAGPRKAPSEAGARAAPAALDALVLQCLATRPEDRPAVDECLEVLQNLAHTHPWSDDDAHAWWRESGAATLDSLG